MKDQGKLALLLALLVVLVGVNLARRSPLPAPLGAGEQVAAAEQSAPAPSSEIPDAVLQEAWLEPGNPGRTADIRRNIFEYGTRVQSPAGQAVATPPGPSTPPPPPAPVRFYGFVESSQGGKRQVFLTDGEEIYVAAEGDIILRRYRLLRVRSESVEVEELMGKQRWVVPLEQP